MATTPQPLGSASSWINHSLSETASVSMIEIISGLHFFKIANYSLQKDIGIGKYVRSKVFTVGGCEWTIKCYPGGHRMGNSDYVSVFLCFDDFFKDAKAKFSLSLLDRTGKPMPETIRTATHVFTLERMDFGWPLFITRCKLEEWMCLIDDCFTIKCEVQVIKAPRTEELSKKLKYIAVPPSNLHEHLGHLLENGIGADVTFFVAGESFNAHRNVLAARSRVFDAELFGSTREQRTQQITIYDIEAQVFKTLLHFIYKDSLPKIEDLIGQETHDTKARTVMLMQHLLVAANRYELERLRLLCENELCKCVDVSTLAKMLVLAEQQDCEQLKNVCHELMAGRQNRLAVMASDGFKHLLERS